MIAPILAEVKRERQVDLSQMVSLSRGVFYNNQQNECCTSTDGGDLLAVSLVSLASHAALKRVVAMSNDSSKLAKP